MKLLVATTNPGKLKEIKRILEPIGLEVVEPTENIEVEETGTTFLENAYLKANAYYDKFKLPTLADDSGLVVDALGGYPGVYSSRFHEIEFGGKEPIIGSRDETNIRKLLRLMKGREDRSARFVAFVVLYFNGKGFFAEGECKGTITESPRGQGGFGYDPIFKPEGFKKTMAELSPAEKDAVSHRGKALRNMSELLSKCKL
ncbi:XTP/dITP diphosphohydrolase [Hydrogenivirga caldilitoris]|uniref:dITP/XTP pyrophosphatase n=1 Tax=Hydrogenivirga caldilitoris TaxID=246264 RepID=A0A497XUE9_9AQUI|nr:RdgB/HAM1 family non-canonical purine NTP pyrophosphatase [Hydrogenivirga caldilitoris]RLJ70772.1 XTP/dITP diphosphohydrolase [Hydrogenivirga caldilitoris]